MLAEERVVDGWLVFAYAGNPPIQIDAMIFDRVLVDDATLILCVGDLTMMVEIRGGAALARDLGERLAPLTRTREIRTEEVCESASKRLLRLRSGSEESVASLRFGDFNVVVRSDAVRIGGVSWWSSDLERFAREGTAFAVHGGSMQAALVFLAAAAPEPHAEAVNLECGIHSMAITETGPSRSPKPVHRDHRNRFIAIGGPANLAVIT